MARKGVIQKVRLNLKLEPELKDWIVEFADTNHTTVSALIRDYFLALRMKAEEEKVAECVEQL